MKVFKNSWADVIDFINAEKHYFKGRKEFFLRKERNVELFLLIFGLIFSYSWKSDILEGILPILLFGFVLFILLYYSLLPASSNNNEFKYLCRLCAGVTALLFSSILISLFFSTFPDHSRTILVLFVSIAVALFVLVLRLLYI